MKSLESSPAAGFFSLRRDRAGSRRSAIAPSPRSVRRLAVR